MESLASDDPTNFGRQGHPGCLKGLPARAATRKNPLKVAPCSGPKTTPNVRNLLNGLHPDFRNGKKL